MGIATALMVGAALGVFAMLLLMSISEDGDEE